MALDPKSTPTPTPSTPDAKGIRIFTYPKTIFIFPTLIAALLCGIGMKLIGDELHDPTKPETSAIVSGANRGDAASAVVPPKHARFLTSQNLLAMLFLVTLAFNMIIQALDFPRFT